MKINFMTPIGYDGIKRQNLSKNKVGFFFEKQ